MRPGFFRFLAVPAPDVWHARSTFTQYAVGPRAVVAVSLQAAGLRTGDVAGLALFERPYAWLGVQRDAAGLSLVQFDARTDRTTRIRLSGSRLWLRVECDFVGNEAGFHYSVDRKRYLDVGEPHEMSPGTLVSQGVACSLFCVGARDGRGGGHAEFGSFEVSAQRARHRGE